MRKKDNPCRRLVNLVPRTCPAPCMYIIVCNVCGSSSSSWRAMSPHHRNPHECDSDSGLVVRSAILSSRDNSELSVGQYKGGVSRAVAQ